MQHCKWRGYQGVSAGRRRRVIQRVAGSATRRHLIAGAADYVLLVPVVRECWFIHKSACFLQKRPLASKGACGSLQLVQFGPEYA